MTLDNLDNVTVLGDTHFGERQFSAEFFESQLKFMDVLIHEMKVNGSKVILQLGDLFTNRQNMSVRMYADCKKLFTKFKDNDIRFISLLGNHDIYYKNSLQVNSHNMFDGLIESIQVQTDVTINGYKCLLKPWMTENEQLPVDYDFIIGHFAIRNFEMVKGYVDTSSMLTNDFFMNTSTHCISGHYHLQNMTPYVSYIGTPWELNWNDSGTSKGAFIWDKEWKDAKFIENTVSDRHVKVIQIENGFEVHSGTSTSIIDTKDIDKVQTYIDSTQDKVKFIKSVHVNDQTQAQSFQLQLNLRPDVQVIDNTTSDYEALPEFTQAIDYIKENIKPQFNELLKDNLDIKEH